MPSQYHSGEREAQRLAGEQDIADAREGMVQAAIPPQVYGWLSAQNLLAAATLDATGRPWANIIPVKAGALKADGTGLWIDHIIPSAIISDLKADSHIGLLAIDLVSRQRMRINGTATAVPSGLHVSVREAFFNCPKYITRRSALPSENIATVDHEGSQLNAEHLQLLTETDVLFLATTHPERGLDVSHRGGDPGFVHLLPDGTVRLPDYPGNSLFNSLGNLLVDNRIALAIPNLRTGTVLQITGTATVQWHGEDQEDTTGGTHRFVDITVSAWRTESGGPLAGATADLSPFNPHSMPV